MSKCWMEQLGGIVSVNSFHKLIEAIKNPKDKATLAEDYKKFASMLAKFGPSVQNRRMMYQAAMHVASNCPFNVPIHHDMGNGKTITINETHYPSYSDVLHGLIVSDIGWFRGVVTMDGVHEIAMLNKWELFRNGYFVARDTKTRSRFSIPLPAGLPPEAYKRQVEIAQRVRLAEVNETLKTNNAGFQITL